MGILGILASCHPLLYPLTPLTRCPLLVPQLQAYSLLLLTVTEWLSLYQ